MNMCSKPFPNSFAEINVNLIIPWTSQDSSTSGLEGTTTPQTNSFNYDIRMDFERADKARVANIFEKH